MNYKAFDIEMGSKFEFPENFGGVLQVLIFPVEVTHLSPYYEEEVA